ncbi:MAG: DUF2924 domain-containing protein [Armatimonadota bacterium]
MDKEKSKVQIQIERLSSMPYNELKALWKTICGCEPPTYHRQYLELRLAYRIQEFSYGGLSDTTRDKMRQILKEHDYGSNGIKVQAPNTSRRRRSTDDMPVLGTKLVREWKGVRHEVMVVPGGIEYQGKRYRSLSAIARSITGTSWNGRVFFGLGSRGNTI